MSADRTLQMPPELIALRARIDRTLDAFLSGVRAEMATVAPEALLTVDEVIRLIAAGGKRLRPAFCYWGYRAAGGVDGEPIERAASALELLHTMALIHDDLMDRSPERRGAPASAIQLADRARSRGSSDPERAGMSLALLAGDLAAVLADRLLLTSGFEPHPLIAALDRYHRMRTDMALGQSLDVAGGDADAGLAATLKGGSYTVEGPLLIGAALADGDPVVTAALSAYGAPLGLAFQLLDDERDGEATLAAGRVSGLIGQARAELDPPGLDPGAAEALSALADLVANG
ncbi:MAG: polyprenyl synthetase family protein [Actinomycetota bacterium]